MYFVILSNKMSHERSPKRSRIERRMEMLITATSIMGPDEALNEMNKLKSKICQLHHERSKIYSLMYDGNTQQILVKFSNGKITSEMIKELRDNLQKELNHLRDKIVSAELEFNNLKAFFENE